MTVAPHVFLGLNALGKMFVLEKFYVGSKEKEGNFDEEQIVKIEKYLKEQFPDIFQKKRHQPIAVPRQSVCYILESFSLRIGCKRIGKILNIDHATVIHARRKVTEEWLKYEGYDDKVKILKEVKVKLMPFLIKMEFEYKNQ